MTERGSTHHSARVDEEMHKETESLLRGAPVEARAQDWRRMEAPGDGEPLPDAHTSLDDIELRSLIATSLRPSAFPGDRARLLQVAEEEHADQRILDMLGALPATRSYVNVEAVWEALGGTPEARTAPQPDVRSRREAPARGAPVREAASQGTRVDDTVVDQPRPVVAAPARPAPDTPVSPVGESAPSIASRVLGLARAGFEFGVGAVIGAVQSVRRRF
jgi:Protein of unknown function (DUF2795)